MHSRAQNVCKQQSHNPLRLMVRYGRGLGTGNPFIPSSLTSAAFFLIYCSSENYSFAYILFDNFIDNLYSITRNCLSPLRLNERLCDEVFDVAEASMESFCVMRIQLLQCPCSGS